METWKFITIPPHAEASLMAQRLNALGSLYYFARSVLGKRRLTDINGYHGEMCRSLETEDLHLVLESPMSHFKTTLGSEALPIWWSLPFTNLDQYRMEFMGYSPEWIRWMKVAHNQNARTLITHEIEGRAIAMGKAIDQHYENNDRFRSLFPEILPDTSCTWNDHTKFQKRNRDESSDASTGTFEFRGVGGALQGLHVTGIVQDDNVGRAAQYSVLKGDGRVMEDTIRWHKQVGTRFDQAFFTKSGLGRQLVIGNRWAQHDLNAWIRENQPEFTFETHSAEGGCCDRHPAGEPIFPGEWSMEKLAIERRTLGPYDYAAFYLNKPVPPEECMFSAKWIRKFTYKFSRPDLPAEDYRNYLVISHGVREGEVLKDLEVGVLQKRMIVDIAHAKKQQRARHVIAIVGFDTDTMNFYLLDLWAKSGPYSELVSMMYRKADLWGLGEAYLETVAAQNLLKFHIDEMNRLRSRRLNIQELRYDNSVNAKKNRIESMEPIYRNEQFWCHPSLEPFWQEFESYPASTTVDVLDTLGYAPETFRIMKLDDIIHKLVYDRDNFEKRVASSVTGY